MGALVALEPDADERRRLDNAFAYACRGTWSNCNAGGMSAVTRVLTEPELKARVERERGALKALLDRRVARFNELAGPEKLRYPRYDGGFFTTVFCDDALSSPAIAFAMVDPDELPEYAVRNRSHWDELADDYVMGAAVRAAGYEVATAPFLVGHYCFEASWRQLLRHQIRVARTIKQRRCVSIDDDVTRAAEIVQRRVLEAKADVRR